MCSSTTGDYEYVAVTSYCERYCCAVSTVVDCVVAYESADSVTVGVGVGELKCVPSVGDFCEDNCVGCTNGRAWRWLWRRSRRLVWCSWGCRVRCICRGLWRCWCSCVDGYAEACEEVCFGDAFCGIAELLCPAQVVTCACVGHDICGYTNTEAVCISAQKGASVTGGVHPCLDSRFRCV